MSDFPSFVFLGSSPFSVTVLETLATKEIFPSAIITTEDKPQGRHLELTPTPVRVWANKKGIKVSTNIEDAQTLGSNSDLFLIAAYGKILPKSVLSVPKYGVINVHPSLLPKYRGSSPIQTALINGDKETAVTIMLTDEKMDHGPILKQTKYKIDEDASYLQLEKDLAVLGAVGFAETAPEFVKGKIKLNEQEHGKATFTKMILKFDGLVDLTKDSPETIVNKVRAYTPWPSAYFFIQKNNKPFRVIIKQAVLENGKLVIKRLKPEGDNEMDFDKFKIKFPESSNLF